MIDTKYFKRYRANMGFLNQSDLKTFLSAKDIKADIDYDYISKLNARLKDILIKLDNLVATSIRCDNITEFLYNNIDMVFKSFRTKNIIPKLNNQGRRPEQVYFSWLRGSIICNYFKKAISQIFNIENKIIYNIGQDNVDNLDGFARQPTADLEIKLGKKVIRIEVQSGFQGINDIKEHKVREAKKQLETRGINSVIMHVDMFNGQVGFVNISNIEDTDINWITRQQMEGQTVFNINQNYFIWKLIEPPPKLSDIKECIFDY